LIPRYAVAFKTHIWDEFIARQFERYRAALRHGDLYIIVDETNGPVGPITHSSVYRTTNKDLLALGLANAYAKGGLIWWNTDYPNYLLFQDRPDYDYYMFVEYDSCVNLDLDQFLSQVAARHLDLVTLPTRQAKQTWYWTKFHEAVYPYDDIRGSLNCVSVYSRRAMELLFERRKAMAKAFEAKTLTFWPGNEVFIPTEIARAGYAMASLEEFGNADGYEWHPPHLEDDLPAKAGADFLHPVLDQGRYIQSVLKFEFDLSSYFFSQSPLRRDLARFPASSYVPHMPAAFRRQVMVKLRQALGAI
jgi:hypothetical protein